ncbi:thiamine pyrophosphate-dependent enzyme, partial [Kitasatospora sp. NPDC059463]|uniref:thiamine pyrophosphate-dependent enzyme n=1 Tax=Kitasatospora sp. NPDC059463 TaxID=3346842 RepID=UPI0036901CBF
RPVGRPAAGGRERHAGAAPPAAEQAVARARSGGGPGFLECRTYRFEGHHTMERRMKLHYRTPEEVAAWRERDPLPRAGGAGRGRRPPPPPPPPTPPTPARAAGGGG